MSKEFIAIVVVITGLLVGAFVLTKDKSPGSGESAQAGQVSNHKVGAGNKKVTLTEYGDFECPACKAYYPIVKELKTSYGDDITFEFRHFPLTQIHQNAFLGSRAAEAAGKQGKFFEMHDLLYENQDVWSKGQNPSSTLETFAKQLGLNVDQFKADLANAETAATINADVKEGQALGASSTPTFAINGKKIDKNPQSIEEFTKLIDDEIAKQNPTQ